MELSAEGFDEILSLAIRRVQTPEGAKKFGQPIGTIITPDMEKYAAKQKAAQQASSSSSGNGSGSSSASTSQKAKKLSPSENYGEVDTPSGKVAVKKSSLSGPNSFKVGEAVFSAPLGSKLVRSKKTKNTAYIVTKDGKVHAFNESGEVPVPDYLQDILNDKFSSLKADDANYSLEEFDETEATSLKDEKPGAVLSVDGEPAFTKIDETTWQHNALGVVLSDSDLQDQFDAGKFELTPAEVGETDFSKLTKDEITAILDGFEVGKVLTFQAGNESALLKKNKEGIWINPKNGSGLDSDSLAKVVEGTNWLSDKETVQEEVENDKQEAGSNGAGQTGVSSVPGSGGGNSGSGSSDGSGDLDDEGDEPLEEHAGFIVPQETLEKVIDLLDASKKITAIKEVLADLKPEISKVAQGGGIAEAKYIVDSIEEKHAFHVDGVRVRTLDKFTENERTSAIQASGGSTPPVYKLEKSSENAKLFRKQMEKSLEGNPYAASVYIYDDAEYEEMDLFLADDGLSGVAIHNGDEIVSVFSTPESKNKKVARHLISIAVQNGGTRLDAFDTILPKIYAAEGFKVKSRLKWNDEYSPEGWDKETFSQFNGGEPDVVFMAYDPEAVDSVYEPGEGNYVDDYEQGLLSTSGDSDVSDEDQFPEGEAVADAEEEAKALDASEEDAPNEVSVPKEAVLVTSLDSPADGDKIWVTGQETTELTFKEEDNEWYSQDGKYSFSAADLQYDIEDEAVFQIPKTDNSSSVSSTPSDEDFAASGLSEADKKSAIEALEAHSGFQVKYGLKSLPDSHPLKNDSILQTEMEDAKKAYPDLPPKKAILAYLKGESPNIAPLADWEQELLEGVDFVNIGSESPKKVQQGMTGGSFTQKEIKDAIDILESYDGKQFKNALVQAGNPVGALSPNDIIGFEKDKLVGKQKYIDFLKGKLEKAQSKPEVAEPKEVSSDTSASTLTADEQFEQGLISFKKFKELKAQEPAKEYTDGDVISSIIDFQNLPVGTRVIDNSGSIYTKIDNDKWSTDIDGDIEELEDDAFAGAVVNGGIAFYAPQDEPEENILQSYSEEDLSKFSMEDVKNLPLGSKFQHAQGNSMTKMDTNSWWITGPDGQYVNEWGDQAVYNVFTVYGGWASPDKAGDLIDPEDENDDSEDFDPDTLEDGYVFKSVAELDALKSGQKINIGGVGLNWEKNENGTFDQPESQVLDIPASNFQTAINIGSLKYVVDKPVFEDLDAADSEFTTLEKWQNDPVGTEYKSKDGNYKYKKTTAGGAGIVSDIYGESDEMSPGDFKVAIKNQFLKNVDSAEYVNGIAPGKYNTGKGAKAHLYVKPDGTGIYVGMKGIKKELDAEGVKKNYDAGMNVFSQFVAEGDYPGLSEDVAETKAPKASKIIPTLGDVSTLPDGIYEGPMGVKYTVSGDSVIASKAVKSMDFTSIKVNQVPDKNFLADAPTGTQIAFKYNKDDSPEILTKNEDGEWKGSTYGESYLYAVENYYAWAHKKWKVHSFPGTDDSKVTKASLKTKYLQGQLVNPETKSSVFPIGYSGSVMFFDGPTDIASLASYRNYLKDTDVPVGDKGNAHNTYGVPLNVNLIKNYIHKKHGVESSSGQEQLDYIIEELDDFLATAKVPEASDLSKLFEFDEYGAATKPLELAELNKPSWYDSTGVWTNHIKSLSALIGDGNIIGVGMAGATKDQKTNWVQYFNSGSFAKMYALELDVAKKKNKPHPTGIQHPGHPENAETHNITWGSAVKGEVPASETIPGDWTSLSVNASLAEIDNYLILAKMQNPTHLNASEKRVWVRYHRQGEQATVDQYSSMAALRAKKNEAPLSEPPVWTDDIKPAKSYDHMFDSTQFPQNWLDYPNMHSTATDFFNDHKDKEPELVALYDQFQNENPYGYPMAQAVQAFFAAKKEAYLEELNKPVWEVKKTISEGSHPTFIVKDQKSEKMRIFKPTTTGKEWRADNEVAAHNLGAMLGFNVPGAVIGEVNEGLPMGANNKGIVMNFAPNVGSLGNVDGAEVDLKTLTPTQFGQLAKEHVFDWFLDNDDTHDENMLIGTDGNLVAIDKGRAFVQYGHWHGLDVDNPESLNINTKDSPSGRKNVVYADMINAIKSGQISQEQLDEAYKQALKAAKRVQKSDDNTIAAFVRSASDQRDNWDLPSYAENWEFLTPHPSNQDELVASVLSRKNSMVEDFEEFYEKLYKAAGFFKPEPPAKALGEEHLSGWEESDVLAKTEEAKVWGAAPIHGSAAFAEGASLLWTEKDTNGNSVVSGKIKLGNITQQKVMDFMASKLSPHSGIQASSNLKDYPQAHVKQWKKTVTAVGKDLSNNATTGDYNDSLWNEMKSVEAKVDTDLSHAETVDVSATGTTTFPSGVTVPNETVPMYVMALNYHKGLIANVEQAKANKEATDKTHFQDFNPPAWKTKGMKYISPEGWMYKELDDGNYVEVKNGVASVVPDAPDAAKSGAPGWTTEKPDAAADTSAEKYSLIQAGMFAGQLNDNGEKLLKSDFNTSGHPGKEYRIDLPTGEKIFFRDGYQTSTVTSQTGTVRFQLNRLIDSESSLSNIQAYLETAGIDMSGADEEQAESIYWRQMFGRIIGSNPSGASASVIKVREKLIGMKNSLSSQVGKNVEDLDIPEAIGLTEKDERTFWHNLAVEAWGETTVNDFLSQGRHLPKYQHMDLNDPEKATGLPWFQRIDVDLEKLYAKGTMLAHGNNGKDKRHFDYIKSGAYTSTEERLRILGFYKTGASSSSDQGTGGASYAFTRIANGQALKNGAIYGSHVMYWSPEVMSMTGTYSYSSDQFGNLSYLQNNNKIDPLKSLEYSSGGNETMIPNNVAIYDFMELMVFENENERLKAIEEFKKKGIEELRGLPIEDRLVLRTKLDSALTKIKKSWKK